jgi:hypothetical protein
MLTCCGFLDLCCAGPLAAAGTRAEAVDADGLRHLPAELADRALMHWDFGGPAADPLWDTHKLPVGIGDSGVERPERSTSHSPHDDVAAVAAARSARLCRAASVHPYRRDAIARLDAAVAQDALTIKWRASAMNSDPASPRCDVLCACLQPLDPLRFEFVLKRTRSVNGTRLSRRVFETRRVLERRPERGSAPH